MAFNQHELHWHLTSQSLRTTWRLLMLHMHFSVKQYTALKTPSSSCRRDWALSLHDDFTWLVMLVSGRIFLQRQNLWNKKREEIRLLSLPLNQSLLPPLSSHHFHLLIPNPQWPFLLQSNTSTADPPSSPSGASALVPVPSFALSA